MFSYRLVASSEFQKILKSLKRKNPSILGNLYKQINKIVRDPNLGKPLRNVLKNRRRVQVGSFVLVYEIYGDLIRLMDFDHHDRIYKKYK